MFINGKKTTLTVIGVVDHSIPSGSGEAVLVGGKLGEEILGTGVNLIQFKIATNGNFGDIETAANQYGMSAQTTDQLINQTLANLGPIENGLLALVLISLFGTLVLVAGAQGAQAQASNRSMALLRACGETRTGAWRVLTGQALLESFTGLILGAFFGIVFGNILTMAISSTGLQGIVIPWAFLLYLGGVVMLLGLCVTFLVSVRVLTRNVKEAIAG